MKEFLDDLLAAVDGPPDDGKERGVIVVGARFESSEEIEAYERTMFEYLATDEGQMPIPFFADEGDGPVLEALPLADILCARTIGHNAR